MTANPTKWKTTAVFNVGLSNGICYGEVPLRRRPLMQRIHAAYTYILRPHLVIVTPCFTSFLHSTLTSLIDEGGIILKSYVEDYHKPLLSLLYMVYFTLVSRGLAAVALPGNWLVVFTNRIYSSSL